MSDYGYGDGYDAGLAKGRSEIAKLRQKLADSQKQIVMLRQTISDASEIVTFEGAPYYLLGFEARDEALAIQPDDSALKAWLGEPIAWMAESGTCVLDKENTNPTYYNIPLYTPKETK